MNLLVISRAFPNVQVCWETAITGLSVRHDLERHVYVVLGSDGAPWTKGAEDRFDRLQI